MFDMASRVQYSEVGRMSRLREVTMKTESVKGNVKTLFGKELAKEHQLSFEGNYEAYETAQEIRSANDMPSDEEVVKFRNTQRANNARQKYQASAVDAAAKSWNGAAGDNPYVEPTIETSPALRRQNIIDSLLAAGKSQAEAERIADAALA